ncbi:unnamed protein product, partial [Owenia fusiformis]
MKIKEIERTANVAWSPQEQYPVYLATGTAAQQLDATFSTSAALELYELNLGDSGMGMNMVGTLPADHRFHKLVWGGSSGPDQASGVLVGGSDNGNLFIWDPAKIIQKDEAVVHHLTKHSGNVAALDFNTFQSNLLASGGSESEIFIWDLNNTANPMTPGATSQPPDDVSCLAWNRQVQHILGSTFGNRCVVWDLRKNEPIIKVSDSMSRIKSKIVAWHPNVATQMCLASEDDHTPVIQLWDLRFATSPVKVLENHNKGILSIAWCPQDPDLLLSCGKDNRILCWNPNSNVQGGEVVYELPTSYQWSFDVQWCPRNPGVISSASFDGHISIYSLMGGEQPEQLLSPKIAESFPNDPFSQAPQQQAVKQAVVPLKKPPKWIRRPVGASFGFGGKLITFGEEKPQNPQQLPAREVLISQVVTETDLIASSHQLESALANQQYAEFCALKLANSKTANEESQWNFLKVNFEKDSRSRFLELLGYNPSQLSRKVAESIGTPANSSNVEGVDASELAQKMNDLNTLSPGSGDFVSSGAASPNVMESKTPDTDSISAEGSSAFDQIAADMGQDSRSTSPFTISTKDDSDGLISQAVLAGNFEAAVDVCLHDDRMAEAILLAIAGGPELLARTQKKYFRSNKSNLTRLISSVVTRDWEHVVRTCDLDNWKEALATALTYASADEFSTLCDILGSRLESEQHGRLSIHAMLCYICAGNVERLVDCWEKNTENNNSPEALQDLVEKVMILRKAVETARGQTDISSGILAKKLSLYAELLAAQGNLPTAMGYLGNSNESTLLVLRDRLYQSLGQTVPGVQAPACPFQRYNIQKERAAPVQQPQAAQQPAHSQQRNQPQATQPFYQTQAKGNVSTTTTPSSTYNYNTQAQYAQFNGSAQPQPTFSAQSTQYNQTAPAATQASKGPLSQRYPPVSAQSVASSYGNVYNPNDYAGAGQQPATSNPYSTSGYMYGQDTMGGYRGYNNAATTSQPQVYNPMAPGAPDMSNTRQPSSSSEPPMPSYQEMPPKSGWNDPPPPTESKKKVAVSTYEAQAPITSPFPGSAMPEQGPPGAPYGDQQQIYNPQQYSQQGYQQQQQGYQS